MIPALTGRGAGPSGTKPRGQDSAAVHAGTAASGAQAGHAENAAEPSHSAALSRQEASVARDEVDGCPGSGFAWRSLNVHVTPFNLWIKRS